MAEVLGMDWQALLAPQVVPSSVVSEVEFAAAAKALGCEVAAIKAVAGVETSGKAFDRQGRPTILFERHNFSRLTRHAYDTSDISDPVQGGYGLGSAQYGKLTRAVGLGVDGVSAEAALMAASWGAFQILGENFAAAGYASVGDYVLAMRSGVGAHLAAFVRFIKANPAMLKAIRTKDWSGFAARYNGPGHTRDGYDAKLAKGYAAALATT